MNGSSENVISRSPKVKSHEMGWRLISKKCYFCKLQQSEQAMPTYNIIGDIHGRDAWKRLVDEDCINIFVGDYFDPYLYFPFETLERNFLEITEFKKENKDKVVLLYGNHDMSYLPGSHELTNRYDRTNAKRTQWLFDITKDLFSGVAYAIGNDFLVTHAGVTSLWKNTYLSQVSDISPSSMAEAINELWNKEKRPFTFMANYYGNDHHGEDPHHSPIWVRTESLCLHNLYRETPIKQIVGHTKVKEITEVAGVVLVDCLDTVEQSYKVTWP